MAVPIRVLIADDEPSVLDSTRELLAVFGFDVIAVSEAKRILPALRSEKPDVLLQDVRMPGLEIGKLLSEIRADKTIQRPVIVVFTAFLDTEERWQELGADALVEKPFDPYRLKGLIERVVGRSV